MKGSPAEIVEKRFKASLAELPEVEHRVVTSEVLAPLARRPATQ